MSGDMDIDLDQDQFDDFSFETEDLLILQNEEEAYLNTQQQQLAQQQQQQQQQLEQQAEVFQQQHTDRVNWNPAQELLMGTQPILSTQAALRTTQKPLVEEPIEPPNTSRFGAEADQIIADLQFKLKRLEVNTSNYNEDTRAKEVIELQQALRNKDTHIVDLKKELSKHKPPGNDTQKRMFPGPAAKQSKRRTNPSQASGRSRLSSQATSLSSQVLPSPIPQQLTPANLQIPFPDKQAKVASTQNASCNLVLSMENVSSIRAPPIPPPGTMPKRPERPINPVYTNSPHNVPFDAPKPASSTKTRLNRHANKTNGKFHDTKLDESERNNKLLVVLFTSAFQRWNITNHQNKKNINVSLDRRRIQEFSDKFSQQFVPEEGQCSSSACGNLVLLASDIRGYLIKSEYANGTIRLLLNAFNLFMPICIKERLHKILKNIVTVVLQLSKEFSITAQYLYKDLIFDSNSILTQFANTLALYPFREAKPPQLLLDHPDIEKRTYGEINHAADLYSTPVTQIAKVLHGKTPKEAPVIITNILKLFYCVGSKYDKSKFHFLMWDKYFLNLLLPKRSYDIIVWTLNVLETIFKDDDWISAYNDEEQRLVKSLALLINIEQGSMTASQWYVMRIKSMALLKIMSQTTQLPPPILTDVHKEVFTKTSEMFGIVFDNFDLIQSTAPIKIRRDLDDLVTLGLETLHGILVRCPKDIFQLVSIRPKKVSLMVDFFSRLPSEHPAKPALELLHAILEKYMEKHS